MLWGALGIAILATAIAPAKADSQLVADAIEKAQQAPTTDGRWVVTATVAFTSESSGKMVAVGPVFVDSTGDELKGTLPMTINDNPAGRNTLALSVNKTGTVSIQWLINGKPYLGRPALVFEGSAFPDYISKYINWGGAKRRMRLTLATEMVKAPRIRVPGGEKKPPPIRQKKTPIGKRYKLDGRLVVTNSEDGVLDNTCEITGVLMYYQRGASKAEGQMPEQPCLTIVKQDANKGFTLYFRKNIYIDHIFAKPETKYLVIRSSIYDDDASVYDDAMNYGKSRPFALEKLATRGEITLPGDRDSENVEVYYTVTAMEDLY